jgi:PAS domain S-box-containing protein
MQTNNCDYQNFFDSLELLLFVISPEGEIIYCNNTAYERLGYSRNELIGQPVVNIHPPEQRMSAAMLIEDMLAGRADFCPIPIQCKDGSLIPVNTRVSLGSWQGKPALFGVTKDITDIKIIDEKFKTIYHAVPDMIALLDLNYKILSINQAMADKLGISCDDAVGLTCYEIIHGTSCPPAFCPNAKLLQDQQTHSAEVHEPRLSGDYLVTVSPIYDLQGNLLGSVHVAHDITLIKYAERKLTTIFQFNPIAVAITRIQDGEILEVNAAWTKLTGYSAEEAVGKTVFDLNLYRSNEEREALLTELKVTGFLNNYPVIMRVKGNRSIVGQFSAARILIDDVECWVTALVDHTDRVKLEDAIEKFRQTVLSEARPEIVRQIKGENK